MEFKEFSNPEAKDYDINSNFGEIQTNNVTGNPYMTQLIDLIGILEDVTEEELQQNYGISMTEYFNPTAETIYKVSQAITSKENR